MSNKRCNVCANPMEVWGYSRMDEHTIFKCLKCGNKEIVKDADIPLPKHVQSLFDRITASPEVLAKELITTNYDEFKDCTVYWAWLGNGRREAYYSREEAIAATVAKLKEVCDE